jgi:hypothetical protein
MNEIDLRVKRAVETRDFTHLNRIQFGYMDTRLNFRLDSLIAARF